MENDMRIPELNDAEIIRRLRESLVGALLQGINSLQAAAMTAAILEKVDPNSPVRYPIVEKVFHDVAKQLLDDAQKFSGLCEKHPVADEKKPATGTPLLTLRDESDDITNTDDSPVPVG